MSERYLSKEEAKRLINRSPSEHVGVTIINTEQDVCRQVQPVTKQASHVLIEKSLRRIYIDQDFFGQLFLHGILTKTYIHGITFPQNAIKRTNVRKNGKKRKK